MIRVSMATEPANNNHPNEDFVGATPTAIALLDGAGSGGLETGCTHGVAWFARQLGAQILAVVDDHGVTLRETLARAILATADSHRHSCDLAHPGTPSATVIIVRVTPKHVEYLVLADSTLLLTTSVGEVRDVSDDREQQIGAQYRSTMDAEPNDTPAHDAARNAYVQSLRAHRNRIGGFWVAAADPSAADQAIIGRYPVTAVMNLVALSDGAARLVDRFHLSTWGEVVRMIMEHGPDALIGEVRAAERFDPRGDTWPRAKATDDATVAVIDLSR